MKLEDQLKEERAKEVAKVSPPASNTVQQEMADTKAKIDAYHLKMELESVQAGYADFTMREKSLESKESLILESQKKLDAERSKFETEQTERLRVYNEKIADYKEQYSLLQTKLKEADKRQEETLKDQAKALAIVKSQTAKSKAETEKREAYEANMGEALKTLGQISAVLKKQSDAQCFTLGKIIKTDLALINRMLDAKSSLFSIADVVTAEITRIIEVAEHLQSMKNTEKLVNYLMSNTDWVEQALKIESFPNDKEKLSV